MCNRGSDQSVIFLLLYDYPLLRYADLCIELNADLDHLVPIGLVGDGVLPNQIRFINIDKPIADYL